MDPVTWLSSSAKLKMLDGSTSAFKSPVNPMLFIDTTLRPFPSQFTNEESQQLFPIIMSYSVELIVFKFVVAINTFNHVQSTMSGRAIHAFI